MEKAGWKKVKTVSLVNPAKRANVEIGRSDTGAFNRDLMHKITSQNVKELGLDTPETLKRFCFQDRQYYKKEYKGTYSYDYAYDDEGNYGYVTTLRQKDKNKTLWTWESKTVDYCPTGLYINDHNIGEKFTPNAVDRGIEAYLQPGVPVVKEEGDLTPPAPIVLKKSNFVNHSKSRTRNFNIEVSYEAEESVNWNVTDTTGVSLSNTDSVGSSAKKWKSVTIKLPMIEIQTGEEGTVSVGNQTTTQVDWGTSESQGGSKTTRVKTSAGTSGDVPPNSRVRVVAIQRKVAKRYSYEIPVSFYGHVVAKYNWDIGDNKEYEKVMKKNNRSMGYSYRPYYIYFDDQKGERAQHDVFYRNILRNYQGKYPFGTTLSDKYRQKGYIDVVNSLEVDFYVFEEESLDRQPIKQGGK